MNARFAGRSASRSAVREAGGLGSVIAWAPGGGSGVQSERRADAARAAHHATHGVMAHRAQGAASPGGRWRRMSTGKGWPRRPEGAAGSRTVRRGGTNPIAAVRGFPPDGFRGAHASWIPWKKKAERWSDERREQNPSAGTATGLVPRRGIPRWFGARPSTALRL